MERATEEQDEPESAEEPDEPESSEDRGEEKKRDKDSPGPREQTEEEKEKQREEDARAAQERMEEVMDAPPEEHPALKAEAVGATIVLIGALFVIFGVIVALAFSPWGWVGVLVGVIEILVGQMLRRREIGSPDSGSAKPR